MSTRGGAVAREEKKEKKEEKGRGVRGKEGRKAGGGAGVKAKEEVGSEGPASRAPRERTRGRCRRGAGAAPGGGGCAQPLWLVEYVHQEFWFVSRRRLGHGIHLHPHHRIPAVAIFLTLVGAFWAIRWYLACRRIRGRARE